MPKESAIKISTELKDFLAKKGKKGETYEDIMKRLYKTQGIKFWNNK